VVDVEPATGVRRDTPSTGRTARIPVAAVDRLAFAGAAARERRGSPMAYTFLSWLRSGLAAAIEDQPQAVGAGRRAKLQDGVNVAGTGLPAQTGTTDLDVLGPGDVSGTSRPGPTTTDMFTPGRGPAL
jgi:hypothetical protein